MDREQQRTRRMEPKLFERLAEANRKLQCASGSVARLEFYRPAQRWSRALKAIATAGPKGSWPREAIEQATRGGRRQRSRGIRGERAIVPRASWKTFANKKPTVSEAEIVTGEKTNHGPLSEASSWARDESSRAMRHMGVGSLIANTAGLYQALRGAIQRKKRPQDEAPRSRLADEPASGGEDMRGAIPGKANFSARGREQSSRQFPVYCLAGRITRAIGLTPDIADTTAPNVGAQISQADTTNTGSVSRTVRRSLQGVNETPGRSSAPTKGKDFDVVASGGSRPPIEDRDTFRRRAATANGLGTLREVTARLAATPEKAALPGARQTSRETLSREASVIHYAPTVVINGSSQALDLDRRILTVMARSGHELSDILRRETARQERTTF
jgi:hypothetical protein